MSDPIKMLRKLAEAAYPHARLLDKAQLTALLDQLSAATARAEAAEAKVRDVETLDEWTAEAPWKRTWVFFPREDDVEPFISLRMGHGDRSECIGGPTPTEARSRAAQWVREQGKGET